MPTTVTQLMGLSQTELDDVFHRSPAGPIPYGNADGRAIVMPGTPVEPILATIAHLLAWRGKIVDAATSTLKNKLTPFDIPLIKAEVYKETSWFDGEEAIILDYSKTSTVAHKVRDEIREVDPGLYLGQVFWGRRRIAMFILNFRALGGPAT